MSTTNDNKRQQLISKLREMFQMDQAWSIWNISLSLLMSCWRLLSLVVLMAGAFRRKAGIGCCPG